MPAQAHSRGAGIFIAPGQAAGPGHGLETVKGPVRTRQRGLAESFPPQPAAPVRQDLLRHRKNISKLADVLGHSSIETTRIYIMESGAEHERLLNQMHLLL